MATAVKVELKLPALHEKVSEKKVGLLVAQWNSDITHVLAEGAREYLKKAGIAEENILEHVVPGCFELPLGAQLLFEHGNVDGVVAIGCLIKGETPHFHYISESVTLTLNQLSVRYGRPAAFGVLTVDTHEQALERAGGKLGNKGEEAAEAALHMMSLKENLRRPKSKPGIGFGGSRE